MSERYVPLTKDTHDPVECRDCGARNVNPIQHERWHAEFTAWIKKVNKGLEDAERNGRYSGYLPRETYRTPWND